MPFQDLKNTPAGATGFQDIKKQPFQDMKASKQLQKQYADFKAEFATLCWESGGRPNPAGFLNNGEHSAFIIPCAWGELHASIHAPWDYEGQTYALARRWSSAAVYLRFWNTAGPCPFQLWGDFNECSSKWNIHRSAAGAGQYVECANACLTELWRRLAAIKTTPADEIAAGIVCRNPAMLRDAIENTSALQN